VSEHIGIDTTAPPNRWASPNRFASLAAEDEYGQLDDEDVELEHPPQLLQSSLGNKHELEEHPNVRFNVAATTKLAEPNRQTTEPCDLPELLQSDLSAEEEEDDTLSISEPLSETNESESPKDIMAVAMEATAMAASVQDPSSTPADMVAFYHAAMYSPAISTLETAMQKGFLPPCSGLSETTLKKYPPPLEATTMGHLDNQRKNIQSTKQKAPPEEDKDGFPEQPTDNQ
jgi:hypothetical protein